MEKKIKWIFVLTIIATCSVILMQAFWLRSQYVFGMEQHLKVHADSVFQKAESFWDETKGKAVDPYMGFMVSVRGKGSNWMTSVSSPQAVKINPETAVATFNSHIRVLADSFSLPEPLPGEGLGSAMSKQIYLLKWQISPKEMEQFLRTSLKDSSLTVADAADTSRIWQYKIVEKHFFFSPRFSILYGFDPLNKHNVLISGDLNATPVLKQLGWLFGGACLWSLLMVLFLMYQYRILLSQYKIDELRKDFSHTMIHELKRPVQTLKMLVALLENKNMLQKQENYEKILVEVREELDNLSAYFSKLRDVTYGDEKTIPLNKTTFDMGSLAESTLRSLTVPPDKHLKAVMRINGKEVFQRADASILISEGKKDDASAITADRIHVNNILHNLLENAVKYSKPGYVSILLDIEESSDHVVIKVKDYGRGIDADDCRHIFEKFFRSRSLVGTDIPGIGLGLSYVRLLVEAHGGKISVASKPGAWTEFTVLLPC